LNVTRRFELGLRIEISFGFAAPPAATTEAPPRAIEPAGQDPGKSVYRPELVTLALCLHRKASPFWIMLLLVFGLRDHQAIQHFLRTRHRRAQITFPLLAQSGHAKNAIDVAIGGKADMACCSAYVRL
jgi:hypothetical protein